MTSLEHYFGSFNPDQLLVGWGTRLATDPFLSDKELFLLAADIYRLKEYEDEEEIAETDEVSFRVGEKVFFFGVAEWKRYPKKVYVHERTPSEYSGIAIEPTLDKGRERFRVSRWQTNDEYVPFILDEKTRKKLALSWWGAYTDEDYSDFIQE